MAKLTRVVKSTMNLDGLFLTSVREMLAMPAKAGEMFFVTGYHANTKYGGGWFRFRGDLESSLHDGGNFISTKAPYPTDWRVEAQREAWYNPTLTGFGVFERVDHYKHNITNFGAMLDASVNANTILNKMSDINLHIYLPVGKLLVESMRRNIPSGGNINQTSMIIYGVPTHGSTDQTYSWEKGSVIQGEGDLFLDVVNTVFENLMIRNTPGGRKGALVKMGAYAQGEFANCIFGECNFHIHNSGHGFDGYNVKPSFRNCRFYGAEEWSRYFEGTVAGYHEQDCYTSHNKRGLYLAAPVSSAIRSSFYEYNDDNAITCDLYGYNSASYQLSITDTFFETNGAGDMSNYKNRSDSHIVIRSAARASNGEPEQGAAPFKLIMDNVLFVDVTDKEPAYGAVYVDSKTTQLVDRNCRIEPAIAGKQKLYTASQSFYADIIGYYGDSLTSVISMDRDLRVQHVHSGVSSILNRHTGSTLSLTNCGMSSVFNTVDTSGSVSLTISTSGGAVVNGDVLVTVSGSGGYATYKYRLTGTSDNKTFTLVDQQEVGGFTAAATTYGHATNIVINAQNNSPKAANVTVAFMGVAQ